MGKIDLAEYDTIKAAHDARSETRSAEAARKVADLWNAPPLAWQTREVRDMFPELADALDELLGGGPLS